MDKGFVIALAASHAERQKRSGLIMAAVCVVVLLLNGTYLYNSIAGPFTVTSEMAEFPGKKEFVQADGNFLFSGLSDKYIETVRILKGAIESTTTKTGPQYYFYKMGDRVLVIRAEPDFSGNHVQGRLVPLPNSKGAAGASSGAVLPYMLDATGTSYRWDFNLFFAAAVVLLPVSIYLFVAGHRNLQNFNAHPMFAHAARHGTAFTVARKVEHELLPLGEAAGIGPLYIGPNWLFCSDRTRPFIVNKGDLAGFVRKLTFRKNKEPETSLEFYVRDRALPLAVKASAEACEQIRSRLAADVPWAEVSDLNSFSARWKADRNECMRATEQRRTQTAAAATTAN